MGILSFIKKIFSEPEETAPVKRSIKFSDIEEYVKKKTDETVIKEDKAILTINENIKKYLTELKENIKTVNNVNIEAKEKNDKIKSAVYEGRKKYIEFLERFIENIEEAKNTATENKSDKTPLERVTEDINLAFLRFNENSGKSYERATILIGKEMGNIRDTLKRFSTELIVLFNEDKEIISTFKKFSLIKLKMSEMKELNERLIKADEKTAEFSKEIIEKENENNKFSESIDKIKNSSEYKENIERENALQIKEKEVENEISELRQLIDFKALSNFFHIFEDRMAIVKLYKDNFAGEFMEDKGNRLLNLLNESKLNNEKIYDKIKSIKDKEIDIENSRSLIKEDETKTIYTEIERIKEKIKNLTDEKEWAEKKKDKIKTGKEDNFNTIKKELESMNLNLED
jgi:hypothetical protein